MITISDIATLFKNHLLNDTTLNAVFVAETGAEFTLHIGEDQRNMPGAEDCPCITIVPAPLKDGQEAEELTIELSIDILISDDNTTTSFGGRVIEYDGVLKTDRLGMAVWSSLQHASGSIALSEMSWAVAQFTQFPLLLGCLDITINVPHVIGAEITL